MNIHLATDHAGYEHKEALKKHLVDMGHHVVDHGANSINPDDDYPDFVLPAAYAVMKDVGSMGVIFGGSGQGEAICANRVSGIRCALYYGGEKGILELSRQHNNANMLSISARFVTIPETLDAVDSWLSIPFSNDERHIRRLGKF